jgi:hypothetical protein
VAYALARYTAGGVLDTTFNTTGKLTTDLGSAVDIAYRLAIGPDYKIVAVGNHGRVAALCECENVSLLGVGRMLSDPAYRRWVVRQVKDPLVRAFWEREFAGYDKRFVAEVASPVQNEVGQLLMAPPLRNVLGQVRGKVDLQFMMDGARCPRPTLDPQIHPFVGG